MATIRWSRVICKEPGNYTAWPTIAKRDGELLIVFSGDREEHVCPYGKTELIRSDDDGETWSAPQIINSTPLDDRDPGLLALRSGTLVVSWFTGQLWNRAVEFRRRFPDLWTDFQCDSWHRSMAKISAETRDRWRGAWTRRSLDGGDSWEPAVPCPASAPHGPIQTRDGRLVYVGVGEADAPRPAVLCVESTDEGASWRTIGTVVAGIPFAEPHVAELPDGELVCALRSEMEDAPCLHVCRSDDGGRTWSMPVQTAMNGYQQPPHLIVLADGRLLCTYGRRSLPHGQRACISPDGGDTWPMEREAVLRDDGPSIDLGYPATAELSPGELLTVYYQQERLGDKVCIQATRWSLA